MDSEILQKSKKITQIIIFCDLPPKKDFLGLKPKIGRFTEFSLPI